MSRIPISHPLDWGNHYHLFMEYDSEKKELYGHVDGPVGTTGTVEHNLATLIELKVNGTSHHLHFDHPVVTYSSKPTPAFRVPIDTSVSDGVFIDICLGGGEGKEGEVYGRYHIGKDHLDRKEVKERLTVFETRMLGNERLYRWLPYPRKDLGAILQRTDLHTHSSAQISAEGLIDIALNHHILYPTRLLDLLHIEYPKHNIQSTRRFFFPPTDGGNPDAIPKMEDAVDVASLDGHSRHLLKAALAIPPDRQMTFGDVEQTVYRYRYPITKHPDAAYDLWYKVAQEYKKQGIVYAEITAVSTSFLTPENLKFLHEALPRIEEATKGPDGRGVKLRFLAGIPRNLPEDVLKNEIEKLKLMGNSPYIVGVDFMGFEDNKIEDMEPHIKSIATWAVEEGNDPEFTLRIHAGENRKNMTNVRESLNLAEKYGMRVRIGHAAHGLDDNAIAIAEKLARRNLVMIEFNPDSNMALNNIDTAEELDMLRCLNKRIPFVICSDGGGLYQTDARQLWTAASFAASFAGVEPDRVASIIQSENDHMALEDERFMRKYRQLSPDFLEQIKAVPTLISSAASPVHPLAEAVKTAFEKHLKKQKIEFTPESIEAATRGKKPLMLLGATGERYWNMISPRHQRQIHESIEKLVEQLDPAQVYFMIGRPKDAGMTRILSQAVQKYNKAHSEKFALISATVQADQTAHSFTPGLTHVLPLTGGLFTVPNQLVDYVKDNDGHLLCIGGGTFVRDAILVARDSEAAFGLMDGPEGASTDKAVMMDTKHLFHNSEGMIQHLKAAHADWFKPIRERIR